MKGYTLIELIIGIAIISIALIILILSADQAVRSFSKSNEVLTKTAAFFNQVTSNFAGQTSGNSVNTLDKVLNYQLVGAYAFFDSIEVRSVSQGYVYALKDPRF
ncbi:MAG TPA: prepilin-type N-terminal cleavage/methylation domain-containing protein [Pseudothermotoga sp.]